MPPNRRSVGLIHHKSLHSYSIVLERFRFVAQAIHCAGHNRDR